MQDANAGFLCRCGHKSKIPLGVTDTTMRVVLSLDGFVQAGLTAYPISEPPAKEGERTTLMFRHLPEWFTRQKMEILLNTGIWAPC